MTRNRNRFVYGLVAVLGIAVASGGAYWWQNKKTGTPSAAAAPQTPNASGPAGGNAAARPVGIEVAPVKKTTLRDDVQAVGTLRSRQNVMLRPEVAGRVVALGFVDGATVRRDQVLLQLDDSLQKAEVKQALSQLSIARANQKRNQDLVAQNFVAQRVLDESAAALQVAEAQLDLACARLDRMRVLAPFDGVVGIRNVNVGDYVKDGADLINLEDMSSLYIDFRLPERYQTRLHRGLRVELEVDALPGRGFKALVEALDPLIDANGRSVGVRALLANSVAVAGEKAPGSTSIGPLSAELQSCGQRAATTARAVSSVSAAGALALGALRPGMFARVNTVFAVKENALTVPEEALVPQADKVIVIKVVPRESLPVAAQKALPAEVKAVSQRVEVKVGMRRPGWVEIVDGLGPTDTVVVAGQQRLQRDGTPVRAVNLAAAAASAAARP